MSSEELTLAHKSKSIHAVVAVTKSRMMSDDQLTGDEQKALLHGHQDDRLPNGDTPGHNAWIVFSIHATMA